MTEPSNMQLAIMAFGALGTWAVGGVAGYIARRQLLNTSFRPTATAYWETEWPAAHKDRNRRLILVQINNLGGAPGTVEGCSVTTSPDHDTFDEVDYVGWGEEPESPLPFTLPGKSAATIVMKPKSGQQFSAGRTILLQFGGHKSDRCVRISPYPGSLVAHKTTFHSPT